MLDIFHLHKHRFLVSWKINGQKLNTFIFQTLCDFKNDFKFRNGFHLKK